MNPKRRSKLRAFPWRRFFKTLPECGEAFFDEKTTEMLVTVGKNVEEQVKLVSKG